MERRKNMPKAALKRLEKEVTKEWKKQADRFNGATIKLSKEEFKRLDVEKKETLCYNEGKFEMATFLMGLSEDDMKKLEKIVTWLDLDFLYNCACIMEDATKEKEGRNPYEKDNWKIGTKYLHRLNSLTRHLHKFLRGGTYDKKSGFPHLGHVMVNAMFVFYWQMHGVGEDDRIQNTRGKKSRPRMSCIPSSPVCGWGGSKDVRVTHTNITE